MMRWKQGEIACLANDDVLSCELGGIRVDAWLSLLMMDSDLMLCQEGLDSAN